MQKKTIELPGDLVPAEWLRDRLGGEGLQVIDIRGYVRSENHGEGRQTATYSGARDEYLEAHIPGASYLDWTIDIVDPDASVKAQIADPARFSAALGKAGVGDETAVVVVDHTGGHLATRLWWALRYYGHDQVAVLDGGFNRWQELGLPVASGEEQITSQAFTASPRPELVSDADAVRTQIGSGDRQIVDARDPDTFAGTLQRGSRGGHIPTAINLPAKDLLGDDGLWKSTEEIREIAEAAGVDLSRPVTAYCNGGVTATATLFGLQRAGLADFSNYDGSWNEWGEREDLPVEGNRDLWNGHER